MYIWGHTPCFQLITTEIPYSWLHWKTYSNNFKNDVMCLSFNYICTHKQTFNKLCKIKRGSLIVGRKCFSVLHKSTFKKLKHSVSFNEQQFIRLTLRHGHNWYKNDSHCQ